jgi:hypothetical protein
VLGFNPQAVPLLGTKADRDYTADSDLWAAFAQVTWNFSDFWSFTAGGRYTEEEKEATRVINIRDLDTGEITTNPFSPAVWAIGFGVDNEQYADGHNLDGDRKETVFTPLLTLQWEATDDIMAYASWSTGFKSGGFDAAASMASSWEFEEEEATTYELGAKTTWLDGAAEVNVALYRTEYDDLQTSQFDGTLSFVVGNAKETVVQGLELDGRWAVVTYLRGATSGDAIRRALAGLERAYYVDQKEIVSDVYRDYRRSMVRVLVIGCVIVFVVLQLRYRSLRRGLLAFATAALAALATYGAFGILDVPVNIVSTISLLLVLGMGVDYGIFAVDGAADPNRLGATLSSILVSCLTSVFVFGSLALSEQPALRAIGLTTGTGILFSMALSPAVYVLAGRNRVR